jgi:hypothetical protein
MKTRYKADLLNFMIAMQIGVLHSLLYRSTKKYEQNAVERVNGEVAAAVENIQV